MHLSCYDSSVTGYGHAGGGCFARQRHARAFGSKFWGRYSEKFF